MSANTSTSSVRLSDEQQRGIKFALDNRKCGVIAIAGPAGSGKTTLVQELIRKLHEAGELVRVTAMTNKACYVLRRKGVEAETFHAVCMRPVFRPPMDKLASFLEQAEQDASAKVVYPDGLVQEFGKERMKEALEEARLSGIYAGMRKLGVTDVFKYVSGWFPASPQQGTLIIDEASMLGETELGNARQVYSQIILVGDEWQLPPVKSAPVFWDVRDRFCLAEIHRQAGNSQPLKIATAIREGWKINLGDIESIDSNLCRVGFPVIVWRNATRLQLTQAIRRRLGYDGQPPQVGEILICRNGSDRQAKFRGLINNSLWTIVEANGFVCTLRNEMGDTVERERIYMEELEKGDGVPFRFGYVLTAHNSQGSEWDTVMIHNGDAKLFWQRSRQEAERFLYTAVTRSKTRIIQVNSEVV